MPQEQINTLRQDTPRARQRPPVAESGGASKARHIQQTAHQEVDLISKYAVFGSKPTLALLIIYQVSIFTPQRADLVGNNIHVHTDMEKT